MWQHVCNTNILFYILIKFMPIVLKYHLNFCLQIIRLFGVRVFCCAYRDCLYWVILEERLSVRVLTSASSSLNPFIHACRWVKLRPV